ncbi:MAG: helix-turn-helix domain-containing protein [Candidatus Azobacteroides sp.]|nr:helix-turn-helix domain-containing protein [Candidatus Azobacteroides sp.]
MTESLEEFYKRINRTEEALQHAHQKGSEYFDIQLSRCSIGKTSFSYRNFYKVALVLHTGKLYYADKWIEVDRPAILFSTPLIPYAWEATGMGGGPGHFCLFNEHFLKTGDRHNPLADTPLLDISKERIYFIDDNMVERIQGLFLKMQEELKSDYAQKSDILRCYLHLLVHEAMKVRMTSSYIPRRNAGQRTAELFLALLERQFPIEIPHKILTLKTPNDYAERLSVHVNHLNRVVKTTTGKTTSALITNRIVQEGVQLLQHSDYSVGEIAFALGFEEPASFSNFMKKHTNLSPTSHRLFQTV